jgi:(p)ppGpp synthase/HD superfamily hydrolase
MDEQEASNRLGEIFGEALVYAHRLHADQRRKGPDGVPYVAHLVGTSSLVLEAGGDEDQAIAALLHDAAEDQGGEDVLQEIRERFGERVVRIVDGCSDTLERLKPPWRERKEAYLASLPGKPVDVLLVSCADKLYNARAILRDHRRVGDALWERFNASGAETMWYYRGLVEGFRASELESWLVDELEQDVAAIENRVNP